MRENTLSLIDRKDEAAFKIATDTESLWFCIQEYSEGGYDYNLYHEDYSEYDSGIIEDEDLSMSEAALEALKECGIDISDIQKRISFADYDEIVDASYKKWEERVKLAKKGCFMSTTTHLKVRGLRLPSSTSTTPTFDTV